MASIPVALQLYTVRDQLAQDWPGTLNKVKEIGYDVVQLTGSLPYDAEQTKAILDDIGLTVAGIHIDLRELETNLDHWIGFCKTVGTVDLVCPYLPDDRRQTKDDWLTLAGILDEIGMNCREQDMRLSYHNHSFEFVQFDGVYALDMLYANTSPENVLAEIDTYWVQHGGEDPAAYIRKYAGRGPILHIKDMADDEKRSFAEIGNGILDWEAIHQASLESGVEVYCVEQDRCAGDPIDSARISFEFMQKLIGG
jgi:sugar phosphate isomerase/epimerase